MFEPKSYFGGTFSSKKEEKRIPHLFTMMIYFRKKVFAFSWTESRAEREDLVTDCSGHLGTDLWVHFFLITMKQ